MEKRRDIWLHSTVVLHQGERIFRDCEQAHPQHHSNPAKGLFRSSGCVCSLSRLGVCEGNERYLV